MTALKPKDFIAIIAILCYVFLIFNKVDTPLNDFIPVIIGFYFGQRKSGIDQGH